MSLAALLPSSEYGTHGIYLYRELNMFCLTYAEFYKTALPQGEIVVILSHYETVGEVRDTLSEIGGINMEIVEEYIREGSLFLFNPTDAYLIDPLGTFKLARSPVQRAKKEGKKGVTVLADMAAFFAESKIKELLEYEAVLPKNTMVT
jgi:hypothetical protein